MKNTVVSVMVSTPAPEPKKEYCKPSLLEKVEDYIMRVESTEYESQYEWNYLKRLYEKLVNYPRGIDDVETILDKLEDLFEKFANKDHDGEVELDAEKMHRYGNGDDRA